MVLILAENTKQSDETSVVQKSRDNFRPQNQTVCMKTTPFFVSAGSKTHPAGETTIFRILPLSRDHGQCLLTTVGKSGH
jgi:hypothetical protein